VAEEEGIVSFYYFPREDEVGLALSHVRAREGNLISLVEAHAHVFEKGLRIQVNVDGARAILHEQGERSLSLLFGGFTSSMVAFISDFRLEILGRAWL